MNKFSVQHAGADAPPYDKLSTVIVDVTQGPRSMPCADTHLTTNICFGRHVHANQNSSIRNDSSLIEYLTVSPLMAVSGNVTLGEPSTLGTQSAVLRNLGIGSDPTVGGSALVVNEVTDKGTVKDDPPR